MHTSASEMGEPELEEKEVQIDMSDEFEMLRLPSFRSLSLVSSISLTAAVKIGLKAKRISARKMRSKRTGMTGNPRVSFTRSIIGAPTPACRNSSIDGKSKRK